MEAFAREIALRLLTVRARSRFELATALAKKEVPDEIATKVLDRLAVVGLIDDAEFARSWIGSYRASGRSVALLRRELQQKGVAEGIVNDVLVGLDDDRELAAALVIARKKWPSVAALPPEVQYRRLVGAIARRGFGPGVTRAAIDQIRAEMV